MLSDVTCGRRGEIEKKPQDIVVMEGKTAEIRAKMRCVFRKEKRLLIDIRLMRGCFWGIWKGFLTECGWEAEKIESKLWRQDRF